jgi:hypothetical protein
MIIVYLGLVVLASIYIHQGYQVESLQESFVYTFLIPLLMIHHLIYHYGFSFSHIKFYGLRTKKIYIQTWFQVMYKSIIDLFIWFLFTHILFLQYMRLNDVSLEIMYDFIYLYALSIISISMTNHIIVSYAIMICIYFISYLPLHLFNILIPENIHTIEEIFIIVLTAYTLWTLKIVYLRLSTHRS